jgi:hypothetical protein
MSPSLEDLQADINELKHTLAEIHVEVKPQPAATAPNILGCFGLELHDGGWDDVCAMVALLGEPHVTRLRRLTDSLPPALLAFFLGAADDFAQMARCLAYQPLTRSQPMLFAAGLLVAGCVFLLQQSYAKGFETTVASYVVKPIDIIGRNYRMLAVFAAVSLISVYVKGLSTMLQPCTWYKGVDICCQAATVPKETDPAVLLAHIRRLLKDLDKAMGSPGGK